MTLIACVVAVELVARAHVFGPLTLVPVSEFVPRALSLLTDAAFVYGTLVPTLSLVGLSFAISIVTGTLFAYALWRIDVLRRAFEPYLNVFFAVPAYALFPMLVVLFGVGLVSSVFLAVLYGLVAVIANALVGFAAVPAVVDQLARSMTLSEWQYVRKVLLPAAVPSLAVGIRLALVYSIVVVLATEFLLSTKGLGHFISFSYENFRITDMYAGILLVVTFSLVANAFLAGAQRRVDWRES